MVNKFRGERSKFRIESLTIKMLNITYTIIIVVILIHNVELLSIRIVNEIDF